MDAYDESRLAEFMDPTSSLDGYRLDFLTEESPAVQQFRAGMYARERALDRLMVNDPDITDVEYSLRSGRLAYLNVKILAKMQFTESRAREEGQES